MRSWEWRSASTQLLQQLPPVGGDRVPALRGAGRGLVPLGRDEALLLERAQQPVEVAHLDPLLAGQLGQALEQVVAVRRPLPEEKQERRLGEALDAGEDAPVAAVVPPGAGPVSHRTRCKTHM